MLSFYIVSYYVDITVAFTLPSYRVLESNGPAQPVLHLSHPVDCCSTISVWVYVEGIDAKRKYLCGLLCLHDVTNNNLIFHVAK